MRKKRDPLENAIENSVIKASKKMGLTNRKMNGLGFNSWPDRMFLGKLRKVLFIEFKRLGKEPTESQAALHTDLRAMGFDVEVCDSVASGIRALKEYFHG
jgi:hypothetical protein